MNSDLDEYEKRHGIDLDYREFFLVMADASGQSLGVLHGYTAYEEIYIDDLWVDSRYRRSGLGRQLMQALENSYEGKGFNNINLVTSAFQAPAFYEKCGFELEFKRVNTSNPRLTKFFFVKYFSQASPP